ncbi:hypothetical protein BZL30_8824 [Mycobacterium kansasii]|uniref:Uncharacterized protein n=1 Tax=Mycobacterium kansasii TaxID=1768 RepID=A0A1V3WD92_MYCKA|nr:hypothetical protein BZL30_8824 [Mycobacterium kansasii]
MPMVSGCWPVLGYRRHGGAAPPAAAAVAVSAVPASGSSVRLGAVVTPAPASRSAAATEVPAAALTEYSQPSVGREAPPAGYQRVRRRRRRRWKSVRCVGRCRRHAGTGAGVNGGQGGDGGSASGAIAAFAGPAAPAVRAPVGLAVVVAAAATPRVCLPRWAGPADTAAMLPREAAEAAVTAAWASPTAPW